MVFTGKYYSNNTIERYKRFYSNILQRLLRNFRSSCQIKTVIVLLSLATNLDWLLNQLDVKTAFLSGNLEEKVYMDSSPSFEYMVGSNVCKNIDMVSSNLQGLGSKYSPRHLKDKKICRVNQTIPYSWDLPTMVRMQFWLLFSHEMT